MTKEVTTQIQKKMPLWGWVAGAVIVLGVVAAALFQSGTQKKASDFKLITGDSSVLVLLRNKHDGNYSLQYTGSPDVTLQSVKVMLAGEVLHVDVDRVAMTVHGQEFILDKDGTVPAGNSVTLAKGDTIDFKITFLGQTLGSNYVYGFRLNLLQEGVEKTSELQLDFDYGVYVE